MTFSGTAKLRESWLTALVDTSAPPVTCPARGRGRAPPPAPRCPAGPRRWADTPGGPAQGARGHEVTRSHVTRDRLWSPCGKWTPSLRSCHSGSRRCECWAGLQKKQKFRNIYLHIYRLSTHSFHLANRAVEASLQPEHLKGFQRTMSC